MSGDFSLYVWASYAMGIALAVTELALLRIRERAIRQHLGPRRGAAASRPSSGDDASGSAPGA